MTVVASRVAPGQVAREMLRHVLQRLDERYRARGELLPVGPMLFVGRARHCGPSSRLSDGTTLEHGAWIGRLHFNNARAAALQATSRVQAGVRFARLLRVSLAELAARAANDARLADVAAFEGTTWLRAHGAAVGFDARPLPPGPRRWWLAAHFRLLLWAFAPVASSAAIRDVKPHLYRISRRSLIDSFGVRGGRA
jgi:hypothetical protein